MGHQGDEELVQEYQRTGDMRPFDELVRRHVGKVRAMVYPMFLNDADADDVTQEVFLRVARGLSRFKGRSQFRTWLYRITMNTARSYLRKRSRLPTATDRDVPETQDESQDPVSSVAASELDQAIGAGLSSLSSTLRAAITLTAVQGMSVGDAAKVEDCLPATMYWRVHQARKQLKVKLGHLLET